MTAQPSTAAVAKVARGTLDDLRVRIEKWLNDRVAGLETVRVTGLASSDTSGLSGETYVVSLECPNGTAPNRVVLRKDVTENQTNPQTNFANLVRLHTALGGTADLHIPSVLGVEDSSELLGAPFLVMEFVEGDIPADVPSYATAGFVFEASELERSRMWRSGIEFLVRLHGLDWRGHGLEGLRFDIAGDGELDRCIEHAISMYRSEAQGRVVPICEAAIRWLRQNRPQGQPESICWGDARIGNMIWRDFECVAVIDWEMCSLGSPAVDLGWWSFFHRWSTHGQGNPELAGMAVGQPLADLYQECGGARIDDFRYFEVLAAVRGLSIWLRTFQAMSRVGALPADMDPLDDSIHMVRVLRDVLPSSIVL